MSMPHLVTPGLSFYPVDHGYTLDGVPLISVTQVLKNRGLIDTSHFTEESRLRGTAVHEAIHFLNEGDLDWSTVDERLVGYLKAYQKFLRETDFQPIGSELCMGSSAGYGGTLDAFGPFGPRGDRMAIVDYKTGSHQPAYHVQLAAYHDLLLDPVNSRELGLKLPDMPTLHFTCELQAAGGYTLHPFDSRGLPYYRTRWREALNLTHFMQTRRP